MPQNSGMPATMVDLPPNLGELRLIDLVGVGSYNNLNEPKPWSNDTATLQILTILFLVCICCGSDEELGCRLIQETCERIVGTIVGICNIQVVRQTTHGELSRLG